MSINHIEDDVRFLLRCVDDLKAEIDELKVRVAVLENRGEKVESDDASLINYRRSADRIDGYDRDDTGESPDQ